MSFVIFNPATGLYFRQPLGKPHSWVKDPNRALQFGKQQRAKNFLCNNFVHTVRDLKPEDMQLIDRKAQAQAQPAAASAPLRIAGEADAQELVSSLPQMVEELTHSADVVQVMERFYAAQQKKADLESIDLLHKIEFTELDVISGFLLCRQLQEVRLRRRRAKDSLELLSLFHESGLFESLGKLQAMIGAYRERIGTRSYLPRVLDELFEAFPKTLEPPTDPLAAAEPAPAGAEAGTLEPVKAAPAGTDSTEPVKPAPVDTGSDAPVKIAPAGSDSMESVKPASVDSDLVEPAEPAPEADAETSSPEQASHEGSPPKTAASEILSASAPVTALQSTPEMETPDGRPSRPAQPVPKSVPETIAPPRHPFKRRVVNSRARSHLKPGRRRSASRRTKKPGRRRPVSHKFKKHVRRISPRA